MAASSYRQLAAVGVLLAVASCTDEASVPRVASDPLRWCRETNTALARSDAARLEALFVDSTSDPSPAGIERARKSAAVVRGRVAATVPLLAERPLRYQDTARAAVAAQGVTAIIDRWQGRDGRDFFFGCAVGKATDGTNFLDFRVSPDRGEVERYLRAALQHRPRPKRGMTNA